MGEELLETEAVELPPVDEDGAEALQARPLPARPGQGSDLSPWRDEVRSAALAAAGGIVAGAATVAVVRASRSSGARRPARRSGRSKGPVKVVASRSFMVDVHLLDR
jgi:hypothetical protein